MAVWVEQAHADAILALLEAALPLSPPLVVYDGAAPADPAEAYVLVYIATTTPSGTSLTSVHDRAVTRAYCHCVGRTKLPGNAATAARAVAGRVSNALLNVKPTIAGRVVFPIRDDGSDNPPQRQESTGWTMLDRTLVFRLESSPARTLP